MKLFENKELKLEKFISGSLSNNSYLIRSKTTDDCFVIDVPDNPRDLINKIPRNRIKKSENLEKIKILITHGHYDHIEGLELFSQRLGLLDVNIGFVDANYLNYPGNVIRLRNQKEINIPNVKIDLIYTPGHTEGSVCYYADFKEKKFLFSGDTLFPGGPGKTTDSQNFKKIYDSIKNKIYSLPKDTIILPGHGESITLEDSINEFNNFQYKNYIFGDITWQD
ncbi:MAG: MBL fold metallo-hydrolase [Chloroflexota bacterium]|nr:MBL fold metallo-hydrolase [Chloroflexota bacterium]